MSVFDFILETPSGCWEWQRGRTKDGYGVLWVPSIGKNQYVHRLAYEEAVGPIPEGMKVCHSCDNPPCLNPYDLFLGTQLENIQDAVKKGRLNPKSLENLKIGGKMQVNSVNRKFNGLQVREIRSRYTGGESLRSLSRDFNCAVNAIHGIVTFKTYKDV